MAKRTYQITVEGPERIKALNALLVALGFEKVGTNEYAEPAPPPPPARRIPARTTTRRVTSRTSKAKSQNKKK